MIGLTNSQSGTNAYKNLVYDEIKLSSNNGDINLNNYKMQFENVKLIADIPQIELKLSDTQSFQNNLIQNTDYNHQLTYYFPVTGLTYSHKNLQHFNFYDAGTQFQTQVANSINNSFKALLQGVTFYIKLYYNVNIIKSNGNGTFYKIYKDKTYVDYYYSTSQTWQHRTISFLSNDAEKKKFSDILPKQSNPIDLLGAISLNGFYKFDQTQNTISLNPIIQIRNMTTQISSKFAESGNSHIHKEASTKEIDIKPISSFSITIPVFKEVK